MHYRTSGRRLLGLGAAFALGGCRCSEPAPAPPPPPAPIPVTAKAAVAEPQPSGPTLSAKSADGAVVHAPRPPVPLSQGAKPTAASDPWTLAAQPALLVWRFNEDGPGPQVELLAPDGKPWPQTMTVLRGKRGLIVELKPLSPLPAGQPFRVVGRLGEAASVATLVVEPPHAAPAAAADAG